MTDTRLATLLGDYAITRPLKRGEIASPSVAIDFADVPVPNTAFKRVVRTLEFDVAELAIVTYLMAKAQGVALTLLPVVLVARFQHPFILYNAARGPLTPRDLPGRRVAVRSWTVTTVAWIKAVLADDHGVDLDAIRWVTFEDAHVAGFEDPPGVERAAPGKDLAAMLRDGEVDAAVIPGPSPDPSFAPLIPDPHGAARAWQAKHGAIQINHMVAVKSALAERRPDVVREVYRMLAASKSAAGLPRAGEPDLTPFGLAANRRNLDLAIGAAHAQRLIPRRFAVEELFDDVTRAL